MGKLLFVFMGIVCSSALWAGNGTEIGNGRTEASWENSAGFRSVNLADSGVEMWTCYSNHNAWSGTDSYSATARNSQYNANQEALDECRASHPTDESNCVSAGCFYTLQ